MAVVRENGRIAWEKHADRKLLSAIDCQRATYGEMGCHDWAIVAQSAFQDPSLVDDIQTRFFHLTDMLKVETAADFDAYQMAAYKSSGTSHCGRPKTPSSLARQDYDCLIKTTMSKEAKDLEKDLLVLANNVHLESLYSRDVWKLYGGIERMSYMRYLDVVDGLRTKLLKTPECFAVLSELDPGDEMDFRKDLEYLESSYQGQFNRTKQLKNPPIDIPLEKLTPLPDAKTEVTLLRNYLDSRLAKTLFDGKTGGRFSLSDWNSILDNGHRSLWSRSRKPPDSEKSMTDMDVIIQWEVATMKRSYEIILEFCTFLLPNFWLVDYLKQPNGLLIEEYQLHHFSTMAWTTIYHSMEQISFHHVRKTVLFLVDVGILSCYSYPVQQWTENFIINLIRLPCGENWNANPDEFEMVRETLKKECTADDSPFIWMRSATTGKADLAVRGKCRKGKRCVSRKKKSSRK